MTRVLGLGGIGLVLVVLGCGEGQRAPEAAGTAAPAASSGTERTPQRAAFDRAHHMQASLWLAIGARDALINGELVDAKASAGALATHDYAGTIPESWQPLIGAMQRQAGELAGADDIEHAAQSLAALALGCGNCHYQQSAGPSARYEPPVEWRAGPDALDERMARHSEGAEQMWIGLVQPSNEAWRSGTISLTRAPLAPPATKSGEVDARSAQAIERIRWLARRARAAATYPERGLIYGELIATCGTCHATTPRP